MAKIDWLPGTGGGSPTPRVLREGWRAKPRDPSAEGWQAEWQRLADDEFNVPQWTDWTPPPRESEAGAAGPYEGPWRPPTWRELQAEGKWGVGEGQFFEGQRPWSVAQPFSGAPAFFGSNESVFVPVAERKEAFQALGLEPGMAQSVADEIQGTDIAYRQHLESGPDFWDVAESFILPAAMAVFGGITGLTGGAAAGGAEAASTAEGISAADAALAMGAGVEAGGVALPAAAGAGTAGAAGVSAAGKGAATAGGITTTDLMLAGAGLFASTALGGGGEGTGTTLPRGPLAPAAPTAIDRPSTLISPDTGRFTSSGSLERRRKAAADAAKRRGSRASTILTSPEDLLGGGIPLGAGG